MVAPVALTLPRTEKSFDAIGELENRALPGSGGKYRLLPSLHSYGCLRQVTQA